MPEISGGGFMIDTGAHMLNTVADLAGERFVEVAAYTDNYGRPCRDARRRHRTTGVWSTCNLSRMRRDGPVVRLTSASSAPKPSSGLERGGVGWSSSDRATLASTLCNFRPRWGPGSSSSPCVMVSSQPEPSRGRTADGPVV